MGVNKFSSPALGVPINSKLAEKDCGSAADVCGSMRTAKRPRQTEVSTPFTKLGRVGVAHPAITSVAKKIANVTSFKGVLTVSHASV
jgi:hypothetical protein